MGLGFKTTISQKGGRKEGRKEEKNKNCELLKCIEFSLIVFFFGVCSLFQNGGYGTIGHVQWHGLCMPLSSHNSVM
jgi:hypothetical protein